MSDNSKISWCDATWNPVCGCSKVSAGCLNCFAERQAYRLICMGISHYEDTIDVLEPPAYRWSGKTVFVESALTKPLHWPEPRKIFVVSMGDLFHESVPFEWVAKVFYIMAICYWHEFCVLTKRSQRQRDFFAWIKEKQKGLWWGEFGVLAAHLPISKNEEVTEPYATYHKNTKNHYWPDIPDPVEKLGDAGLFIKWPLPNVHLGVTVENNKESWRLTELRKTPAAHKFVSLEPWLGNCVFAEGALGFLDCAFIGCESGPKARLCTLDDIRYLMQQCREAGVKIHIKQIPLDGKCNKNIDKWPEEFRIREV